MWFGLLCFLSCALPLQEAQSSPPPAPRVNIVLVVEDDQDNDHFGFTGDACAHTPVLDELARGGFMFPTAYVTPRCRPTLAELLSGRWPHQNGIYFNDNETKLVAPDSLALLLQHAGYGTFVGGKFWEGDIHAQGFDAPATLDSDFVKTGQKPLFEFLDTLGDKPFFVWWAPQIPHLPHDAKRRFLELIPKEIPAPAYAEGWRKQQLKERMFLASGAEFDEGLGILRAHLAEHGTLAQTLFVFLIDNGWASGLTSKGSPYEKGVSTPLIFWWPGHVTPGRGEALVDIVDVYPTLLDFAGIAIPPHCAGHSLRPWLEGKPGPERAWLCGAAYPATTEKGPADEAFALYARDKRWKYILYLRPTVEASPFRIYAPTVDFTRAAGTQELYDLGSDPYELTNLAGDAAQAERLATMHAAALEWWSTSGGPPLAVH